MEWQKASFTVPNNKAIFNVVVKVDGRLTKSFGYWDGEDWKRVHEADEYLSFEPYFEDYDMEVLYWMANVDLPAPPKQEG